MPDSPATPWPTLDDDTRCPCLSGETYGSCCGPLHRGAPAPSATRLMRSRYSAFVVGDADYLLSTWSPATRPASLELDPEIRWLRLDIDSVSRGGPFDAEGVVEFTAFYRRRADSRQQSAPRSETGIQHERSRFTKLEGRWFYLDGS